jgi:hypothetical protein
MEEGKMRRMGVPLLVVAAALSGGAIARAVVASPQQFIPDVHGVFHGCYLLQGKSAGLLRVLPAADPCPAGTKAVSWNAQGQPGPAGPVGPAGPQGAQGAQGVTVGTVSRSATSVAAGHRGGTVAACPSGQHATGGGAAFDDGAQTGDAIVNSFPSDTNGSRLSAGSQPSGWTAAAYNNGGTSRTLTVYAVCSP